jgi:hypothetical protein
MGDPHYEILLVYEQDGILFRIDSDIEWLGGNRVLCPQRPSGYTAFGPFVIIWDTNSIGYEGVTDTSRFVPITEVVPDYEWEDLRYLFNHPESDDCLVIG